jgi:hypothetical protein
MKRYLICTLLVINAVPAHAAQLEVCKGTWGCETVTSWTDYFGITQAEKQEAQEKKQKEAESLENVPARSVINQLLTDIQASSDAKSKEVEDLYKAKSEAIQKQDLEYEANLKKLFASCETLGEPYCNEYLVLLKKKFDMEAAAGDNAYKTVKVARNHMSLTQEMSTLKEKISNIHTSIDNLNKKNKEKGIEFLKALEDMTIAYQNGEKSREDSLGEVERQQKEWETEYKRLLGLQQKDERALYKALKDAEKKCSNNITQANEVKLSLEGLSQYIIKQAYSDAPVSAPVIIKQAEVLSAQANQPEPSVQPSVDTNDGAGQEVSPTPITDQTAQ